MNNCILSIDAGGTFFKYAVLTVEKKEICEIGSIAVDSNGNIEHVLGCYKDIISTASKKYHILGLGISTPGPFDYKNGISLMKHKFSAINGIVLQDYLQAFLPNKLPIWFCSDSNAFLIGEVNEERYKEKNIFGITMGTGLGFSIIYEGKLLTRESGAPKEVIYNLPCMNGILEDYVSGRGISRLYREYGGNDHFTAKQVALATDTDIAAKRAFEKAGELLSEALLPYVKKYKAERIILGGQVAKSFSLMEKSLHKNLGQYSQVCQANNIDTATLKGVAYFMH